MNIHKELEAAAQGLQIHWNNHLIHITNQIMSAIVNRTNESEGNSHSDVSEGSLHPVLRLVVTQISILDMKLEENHFPLTRRSLQHLKQTLKRLLFPQPRELPPPSASTLGTIVHSDASTAGHSLTNQPRRAPAHATVAVPRHSTNPFDDAVEIRPERSRKVSTNPFG